MAPDGTADGRAEGRARLAYDRAPMAGGGPHDGDFDDGGFGDVGDPADPGPGDGALDDLDEDSAQAALARWAAEAQVADAVARRRRAAWLARQAAADADLVGVATALGERGRPVLVGLVSGRRHRGRITVVGRDFLELATEQGAVWLALGRAGLGAGPDGRSHRLGTARARRAGRAIRPTPGSSWSVSWPSWPPTARRVAVFARMSDEPVVGELRDRGPRRADRA